MTDGWKDVEVPINGTVIVQQGDVHDVIEHPEKYVMCWCTKGKHLDAFHADQRRGGTWAEEPHLVGIQKFELIWEVKK